MALPVNPYDSYFVTIPSRPADALPGSDFVTIITGLSDVDQQKEIEKQLLSGNIPNFMRNMLEININNNGHYLSFAVTPDYLCVGNDDDFIRVPLAYTSARFIAQSFRCSLPTKKLVNDIWQQSDVKVDPIKTSDGWIRHNYIADEAISLVMGSPGQLICGHKRDIVLTNALKPNTTPLHGGHLSSGKSYSMTLEHGIPYDAGCRLISAECILDNKKVDFFDLFNDTPIISLISDEGPILKRQAWALHGISYVETNKLPDWLQSLGKYLPGETPGQHLARCLKAFDGCSLTNDAEKLAWLFSVNEVDFANGKRVSGIQTTCATTYRALLCLAGCTDSLATSPYVIGQAISDVIKIATDCGAIVAAQNNPNAWKMLDEGWGIMYGVGNNVHVEMCLSKPDPVTAMAQHGGGGRAASLISIGTSDIRHSLGRPILYLFNPDKLLPANTVAVAPEPTTIPIPAPNPASDASLPDVAVVTPNFSKTPIKVNKSELMTVVMAIGAIVTTLLHNCH